MIKQIQLRGISRDPSDRSNQDGGCAESLNVQLNEGELAPAPVPKDITSTIGVDSTFKVLYIHKVGGFTNYIGRVSTSLCAKIQGVTNPVTIATVAADPVGITSIGNILVWTTASGTYYAIFRDGTYTYLGDSVPEPTVTFTTVASSESAKTILGMSALTLLPIIGYSWSDAPAPYVLWNKLLEEKDDSTYQFYSQVNEIYKKVQEGLWDQVNNARTTMRGNKTFEAPVMVRYALRLYDGNYIYVSAPVILTGGTDHDHARMLFGLDNDANYLWKVFFNTVYTASVRVDFGSGGLWGDLIEAVDIFMSTDIYVPKIDSKAGQAYANNTSLIGSDAGFEMEGVSDYAWLSSGTTANRFKEDFETEMLNKGNFYRVASIPAYTQEYWVEDLLPKSQDDLVVLPRLSEGDAHKIEAVGGLGSYNHRLILTGEKVTLSRGNQKPDALLPVGTSTGNDVITCFFYVRTSDGGTKIVKGYNSLDIIDRNRARAYITYPDPSCYKAVLYESLGYAGYNKYTLPMKEHPHINASYGFWGIGDKLMNTGGGRTSESVQSISETEDRTYEVDNRLFLSEVDNPFFFPLGQRITFDSKILSAMPITIPLSTGQFGQYQLYVFTKEGIWAETITDEGKIAANHPVTRDAPYEGAIGQLDQGIVFASPSGVMLMYGSEVRNITPAMVAERDVLGDSSATISNLGDWTDLMTIAMDNMQFLDYIKQARFAYDYPGKRILVFRSDKSYAWVYKLDTNTWHKMQLPASKSFAAALNSYPEALVTMMSSGSASVVDFTTVFGDNTYPLRTALVITRNLDLDAPDIRKEIRALKIRGAYRMGGSTKVIVLGSMDGQYFKQLTSLHNGSFKFYKLILLMKLYPDERVSWVDIDCDTRFTNKLR